MKRYFGVILLITTHVMLADVDFREDFWRTTKRLMNEEQMKVTTPSIKEKYEKFGEYANRYYQRALKDKAAGPGAKSSEPGWLDDFYRVIEGKKAQPKKTAKPKQVTKSTQKATTKPKTTKATPQKKAKPTKKAVTSKPKKKPAKKTTPTKKTTSKVAAKKQAEDLAKKAKK